MTRTHTEFTIELLLARTVELIWNRDNKEIALKVKSITGISIDPSTLNNWKFNKIKTPNLLKLHAVLIAYSHVLQIEKV